MDLVVHHLRNADPTRFCERLQPGGDIDAVAEDILVLDDDVAEIDPNPEPDAVVLGYVGLAVDHRPLQFHRTAHRVDDAWEFRQQAIAGILDDAPGMLGDAP